MKEKKHPQYGSCAYCFHFQVTTGKCVHPDLFPQHYHAQRKQGEPCGPAAQLWEPLWSAESPIRGKMRYGK